MQETWVLIETTGRTLAPSHIARRAQQIVFTNKIGFLKCDADKFGKQVPEFQRHMLLASSGLTTTRMCRSCFVFVVNLIKKTLTKRSPDMFSPLLRQSLQFDTTREK